MFSKIQENNVQLNDVYVCNAADTPITEGIGNGDVLIVLDPTAGGASVCLFDADSASWVEITKE